MPCNSNGMLPWVCYYVRIVKLNKAKFSVGLSLNMYQGYLKNCVYAVECESKQQIIERITLALSTVTLEILKRIRRSTFRRACLFSFIEVEGR